VTQSTTTLSAIVISFPASIQLTLDFCRRLDSIVGPQLTVLASDICEQFNISKRASGFVPGFAYFPALEGSWASQSGCT
jgi:hypothetical protein